MLNERDIKHAVDMQRKSYRLFLWMAKAVAEGFIRFETAHEYASLAQAAEDWIRVHYLNIPANARVDAGNLSAFAAFFATYLENSFDLARDPGKQLYSPGAHCFCPMCSWLIDAPNLRTKKLSSADKRHAQRMKTDAIRRRASESGVTLSNETVQAMANSAELREVVSLVAYADDLLLRLRGVASGPAVLALWRGFAWLPAGSPKKDFHLSAVAIMQAERKLMDAISHASPRLATGAQVPCTGPRRLAR